MKKLFIIFALCLSPLSAFAAVSAPTVLTNGSTTSFPSSQSTASITPSLGCVVILSVGARGTVVSSVSGAGLTWTKIGDANQGSSSGAMSMWRGIGVPITGAITFNLGTGTNLAWNVSQYCGVDLVNPIVTANTVTSIDGSSTCFSTGVITINYVNALTAGGAFIASFDFAGGNGSATVRSGWTEIYDIPVGTSLFSEGQYRLTTDTAAGATAPSAGYGCAGVAAELRADTYVKSSSRVLIQSAMTLINNARVLLAF